jgi:fibronectin-binding autotransporter adhesin
MLWGKTTRFSGVLSSGAIVALGLALALSARPVAAQTYTWDPLGQGSTSGFSDGSGTWDTVTQNWWSGTSPDSTWASGNIAQFSSGSGGSTPYNVTLAPGGVITVGGVIFQNQAYTISGDTLTLAGATPTITLNATGSTISSVVAGTAGLAISGSGLLALTGNNSYTGPTAINNGTLALSGAIAGGSTIYVGNGVAGGGGTFNVVQSTYSGTNSNTLVLNGGTMMITGPYNAGTGGAITFSGGNVIQTFTATGISSLTLPMAETAQVLVVGGGGGGGAGSDRTGGGGGGGGVLYSSLSLAASTYSLTVGAGGAGAVSGGAGAGNGGNSVFGTMTARGGGFGADSNHQAAGTGNGTVGSGGGAYHNSASTKGTGTTGQGNSGGGGYDSGSTSLWFAGGGGGGAGAAGATATSSGSGGAGGNGSAYNISGATVYYGGGGGGGIQESTTYHYPGGPGGLGGGGTGGNGTISGSNTAAVAGTNGLGGGGGGAGDSSSNFNGAAGGSGVVIVSYPFETGQVTLSGPISVPVTSTLNAIIGGSSIIVDSSMTGAGGINVTSSVGPGGLVSYALAQSYSGNTTVNSNATLQLGASNALPYGAGAGNLSLSGTLDLNGQSSTNVNGLSGNGLVRSSASGAMQLTVGNNGATSTYGGVLQNGSGTLGLTMAGPGTLMLTGSNTYTGGTTVSGGLLQIGTGVSGNQGSAVLPSSGSVTVASGATINLAMTSETNRTLLNSFSIAGSGSSGLGALAITNNGTTADVQIYPVTLSGNATIGVWGTATNVNSGIHFGEGGTVPGSINLNGYTLTIAGSGATGGFAKLYNTNYIIGSGSIQVASGGNFAVWSGSQSWTNTVAMNPGSTFSIDSGSTVAANWAVSGGTLYSLNGVGTLTGNVALAGTATLGNSYYATTGTGLTLSGNISGAGGLIAAGGTHTLSGSNTFTGNTTINTGSITLSNSAALLDSTASIGATNGIVFSSGVVGHAFTIGGLSGSANQQIYDGTNNVNLSVGYNNQSTTYSGVLSAGGSLTKFGNGVLTLAGANTYSGATAVSAGTLQLGSSGSIASTSTIGLANGTTFDVSANSNYHLTSGQTLTGTGSFTVNGAMTANSGSIILSAGSGLFRTLNVGNLTLNTGSQSNFDIGFGGQSGSQDLISVNNLLTVSGGGVSLYQGDGMTQITAPGTYTLMTYAGSLAGSAGNLSVLNPYIAPGVGADNYMFGASGGSVTVTVMGASAWTGADTPGNINWSDSNNWSSLAAPASGQSLNFAGSVGLTNNNDLVGLQVPILSFPAGAGAFTLGGNSLQIGSAVAGGSIINSSTATQTIGVNLGIAGLNMTISAAAGPIVITSSISDGGAGLGIIVSGSGGTTLTGASSYLGPTSVSGSTLNVNAGGVLNGTSSVITNAGGLINLTSGTIAMGSSAGSNGVFGVGYGVTGTGSVTIGSGGLLSVGAGGGRTFVGGGPNGGPYGTGILSINSGGSVVVSPSGAFPNDQLYLAGFGGTGVINLTGGTLISSRSLANGAGTASVNFNGGTLVAGTNISYGANITTSVQDNGGTINTNGFNVTVASALAHGGVSAIDGGLTVIGPGMATLSANSTFNGGVTINNGGTLSVSSLSVGGTNSAAIGEGPSNATGQNITLNGGMLTYTGGAVGNFSAPNNAAGWNPNIALGTGGGTLNMNSGANNQVAFTGVLSGSGNLTVIGGAGTGPGQQIFFEGVNNNQSPNFTGNLILGAGGSIQIRNSATLPFGPVATIFLNSGSILASDKGVAYSTGIPNNIVLTGGSLSTQGASMNYTGSVTVSGGVNSFVGDETGSAGGFTLGGNLSGSGTATTIGTTLVTLSGANSGFSGTWVANVATQFTQAGAGSPNALWVANGATTPFVVNVAGGGTVSLGGLSGSSGSISNVAASTLSTLSIGALGVNTTYGGIFSNGNGTLALSKVGTGSFTLTGGYTNYTGATTISGGTLQLGNGITNGSVIGPIASSPGTVTNFVPVGYQNFGGIVAGSGSLVMSGTGTLAISGQQTYSGATIISAGTLKFSNSLGGFGGNGAGYTINSSGITSAPFTASNTIQLTDDAGNEARSAFYDWPVPVNAAFTAKFIYHPTITGADGVTFILSNAPNGPKALGGGGGSFGYGGLTPSVAAELNIYTGAGGGVGATFAKNGAINNNNSTSPVVLNSTDPILVTLSYDGVGTLTESFSDTSNGNTFSKAYSTSGSLVSDLGGNTAYLGFGGATGGVASTQQISSFSFSTAAAVSNNLLPTSSDLTLAGGATVDLFGASQTLGSLTGAGTVTNSNPGTLSTLAVGGDGVSTTFAGLLQNGSGTLALVKQGAGIMQLATNNGYSGGTTISGGTLQLGNGGPTGSAGSGPIALNGGWLSFNRSDASLVVSSALSSGTVSQDGTGTTTLAGNNVYAGGTFINNGTLAIGNGGNTGTLGSGPVHNNGQLIFNRGDAIYNVTQSISGTGAVFQNGSGTLTMSGSNTYTGQTTVNQGALYLNGFNATSAISVTAGTLGGGGSANSATATLQAGASVEGGQAGVGSLSLGGLDFLSTGQVDVTGISNYQSAAAIKVTGSNGLAGYGSASSLVFNLNGFAPSNTVPQYAHLLQYSGSVGGTAFSNLTNSNLNYSNLTGFNYNRGVINLTPLSFDPGYVDIQYYTDYPIWTGKGNGVWDPNTQTPQNWKSAATGSPTDFFYGDAVVFDDSSGSNTQVSLNGSGNVDPVSVIFVANTASFVISGSNSIEGSVALTMNGSGMVTINNTNTYGGVNTINAGYLNIGNTFALGQAANGAALVINGGTIANSTAGPLTTDNYPINWNGGFVFAGANSLNLAAGGVTLGGSAAVNMSVSGNTLEIDGVIGDNGQGFGFTQNGSGLLLLTASNTYSGPTVVNGGTLQVGNGGAGASIGSTSRVTLAANTLLLFSHSDTVTFPATIGGSGSVVQSGGLLNLTNSNTFTGGMTVASGALELSNGGPAGTLAPNSTVTVNTGALLLLNASNALGTSASSTALTVNSGGQAFVFGGYRVPLWNTVTLTGGSLSSAGGPGDGNGNYSLGGQINATSDISGNPAYINATQVSLVGSGPVLNVTRGSAAAGPDLIVSSVISSLPSGTGFTLQGTGLTQFTGANTYNGTGLVLSGTLQAGNTFALGGGAAGLYVAGGALVDINGYSVSIGGLNGAGVIDNVAGAGGASPYLTIGGGGGNGSFSGTIQNTYGSTTLVKTGSGTQVLSGTNTYTGGTELQAGVLNFTNSAIPFNNGQYSSIIFQGGTLQWAAGNTQDVSAGIFPSGTAKLDTNGNNVTFATTMSGGLALTKIGAGTLTLAVSNTYTGTTTITSGTLLAGDPGALQNSTVSVGPNNSLAFGNTVSNPVLGGLSGSGNVSLPATTLTVGQNGANTVYSGALNGGTGLIKTGSGTLTLTKANNYGGATNISGGVLQLYSPVTALPSIANLEYWLDASNSLSSGTAASVSSWNDLSGNGNSFTVPGLAVAPALVAGASPTGLSMVQFNYLLHNALTLSGSVPAQTVFIVNTPSTTQQRTLAGIWGNYGADGGIRTGDVNGTWRGLPTSTGDTPDANDFTDGATPGTTYISTAGFFDSNTTNFGSLGTPQVLVATGSADYAVTGLGNYYNGAAGGRLYSGNIGEVVVYNGVLTALQRQQVEAYLDYKWLGVAPSGGSYLPTGANNFLPSSTPLTISNGGTFDMTNGTQTIASLSSTDGNGSKVLLGTFGALTVGDSTSTTFDGVISGAGGSVVKQGAGALVFTGNNTYSGLTSVTGGTLQLGDGVVKNGSVGGNIGLSNNSALVFANPSTQVFAGSIGGNGSVTMNGPGTLQITATHSYNGPTTINAGLVQLVPPSTFSVSGFGNSLAGGTGVGDFIGLTNNVWTVNRYTYDAGFNNQPITNNMLELTDGSTGGGTGAGCAETAFYNTAVPVNKSFNVTFTYSPGSTGSNYGTGMSFILTSTANIDSVAGAGRGFGVGNCPEGAFAYDAPLSPSVNLNFDLYGGGPNYGQPAGAATGYNTNGGTLTPDSIAGGSSFGLGHAINMTVTYNAATQVLYWSGTDSVSNLMFSESEAGVNLASLTGGTSALIGFGGGATYYTSNQTISNFNFSSGVATATNLLPATTPLFIASGGTLDLDGTSQTVASLAGSGVVTNSGGTLSVLTVAGSSMTEFDGMLQNGSGTLALVLNASSGTLVLGGANTYSGGTDVNAGTLVIDSTSALPDGSSLFVGQGASSDFTFAPVAGGGASPAAVSAGFAAVPEPGTLALLAAAVGAAVVCRFRRRSKIADAMVEGRNG